MARSTGRVVALLAVAAAVFVAQPARAQVVGDSARIARVDLTGVSAFGGGLLRAAIVTSESRCPMSALGALCWLGVGREHPHVDPRVLEAGATRPRILD